MALSAYDVMTGRASANHSAASKHQFKIPYYGIFFSTLQNYSEYLIRILMRNKCLLSLSVSSVNKLFMANQLNVSKRVKVKKGCKFIATLEQNEILIKTIFLKRHF